MSLTFLDGFDVGPGVSWMETGSGPAVAQDTNTPFGHGRSLKFPSDTAAVAGVPFTRLVRPILDGDIVQICGFQFYYDGPDPTVGPRLVWFESGGGNPAHDAVFIMGTDGSLIIQDGTGAAIANSPPGILHRETWYFIECLANGNSTAAARVNEVVVVSGGFATSGAGFSGIWLNRTTSLPGANETADMYFDDLYVCNGLGSINDTYLGLGRVQTLLPDGAGADTDLTPNPSAPNYGNVNDVPWSSTDYNYSTTAGDRDLYTLDDLDSATAEVVGIQTVLIGASTDAAAHVKAALKSGGTIYYDATVALNGSPTAASIAVRETDPATSAAWTVSNVNALQAGMEVTS